MEGMRTLSPQPGFDSPVFEVLRSILMWFEVFWSILKCMEVLWVTLKCLKCS